MGTPHWSLGGVPIFVNNDSEKPDSRLSEHIVLDGQTSIIHNFGYGSGTRTLTGHLLDNSDAYPTLESGYHHSTVMTLISDQGTEGSYIIWALSKKRVQDIRRPKPVLFVEMELKRYDN